MAKLHFDEIDICKGLAMLTVLWHHSFIKYPIYMLDIPWCQAAMKIDNTYFMTVFFMISGYLFAFTKKRSFIDNLKNKAERLLIPYLSYHLINLVLKIAFPSLVNRQVDGIGSYVEAMLLRGGELWFVYVLFFIFVIWPFFLTRVNKPIIVALLVVLELMHVLVPGDFTSSLFLYPRIIYYSEFFLLGFLLKDLDRKWLNSKCIFAVLAILFVTVNCILAQFVHIPYFEDIIFNVIGCYFVWSLSSNLLNFKVIAKSFGFVGKYSLSYYWLNGFILVLARTIVIKVLSINSIPVIVVSIFVICVILESVSVLIIRRCPYLKTLVGM